MTTRFTDREAAVEELEFLVAETGKAHCIADACQGDGWNVVPLDDADGRRVLVVLDPEAGNA